MDVVSWGEVANPICGRTRSTTTVLTPWEDVNVSVIKEFVIVIVKGGDFDTFKDVTTLLISEENDVEVVVGDLMSLSLDVATLSSSWTFVKSFKPCDDVISSWAADDVTIIGGITVCGTLVVIHSSFSCKLVSTATCDDVITFSVWDEVIFSSELKSDFCFDIENIVLSMDFNTSVEGESLIEEDDVMLAPVTTWTLSTGVDGLNGSIDEVTRECDVTDDSVDVIDNIVEDGV